MKDFAKFMKKAGVDLEKRVEKVINHAVEIMKKPNPTQEDCDDLWREIKDLHKDLGADATDAAKDEAKEHLTGDMQQQGMSKEQAEKWFEQKWADVKDLAEKFRSGDVKDAGKTALKGAKWAWLKIAGFAAAAAGLVAFAVLPGYQSGRDARSGISDTYERMQFSAQIQANAEQFQQMSQMIDALKNLTTAPGETVTLPPQLAQAAMPLATLPAPVAAIAMQPAVAVITRPDQASETVHTTIGTIYQMMPPARRDIDTWAGGHSGGIHGTIDVRAPFGPRINISF